MQRKRSPSSGLRPTSPIAAAALGARRILIAYRALFDAAPPRRPSRRRTPRGWSGGGIERRELPAKRGADHLGLGVQAQLLGQVGAVALHRPDADEQPLPDLGTREALADQHQDLLLPGGQLGLLGGNGSLGPPGVGLHRPL